MCNKCYTNSMVAKTEIIHARVDPQQKTAVEQIFQRLGLTTTQAIRLFFNQVEMAKGLPFPVRIPNKETEQTFRDTDAGKNLQTYNSSDELFEELGI